MKFLIPAFLACIIIMSCSDSNSPEPQLSRFERFALDTMLIDQFIAENNIQNVQIEPNGVRYVIHEEGPGLRPSVSDDIKIDFEGRLLDGEVFDSGIETFDLEGLITGLQFTVPFIREGGRMTIYIPSFFAWGGFGNGEEIPPFSNVIFELTLVEIID